MNDRSRTSLTPFAHLMRDTDEAGARRFAAQLWHREGIIILLPASIQRLPWQDRELVEQIAGKPYGQKDDDQ